MLAASFRRSWFVATGAALTLVLAALAAPPATAELSGDPVAGSLQQVYYAGQAAGGGSIPSTPIPDCKDDETDPPDCWRGQKLTLQAARIGQTAAEPTIGVAKDGTAYMAGSTLVVNTDVVWGVAKTDARRSTDGGKTWTSIHPKVPVAGENLPPGNADPMIWVDTDTGRVFTFDLLSACNWLSFSDDKGESWTNVPIACGNVPVDHQTIVSAKPRNGLSTVGYPNVLYWCANRVVDNACGRSLDGGLTWTPTIGFPFNLQTSCRGLSGHLEADPDGRIYLPTSQTCGTPWIARSEDNGDTWTRHQVSTLTSATPHTSVAADADGNLYYVWIRNQSGNPTPYLAVSKNRGQTWGAPMMIAPPGVIQANFPVVAAGDAGRIAITFPSTRSTAANRAWDQTVIVSTNALDERPVFLSATGNPPTDPIHRGSCGPGRCAGLWDFLDIQVSPAGEAWAAASDDCVGACNNANAATSATKVGDGIAIRQIGGPLLRVPQG
ncbi:MAG TPA: sialidase family protein [Actinomycetota bacterium]|nr:sialidase family protein [Actinomycetota bacterium]